MLAMREMTMNKRNELLIVCFLSERGHAGVNRFIIRAFADKYDVKVAASRAMLDSLKLSNVEKVVVVPDRYFQRDGKVKARLTYLRELFWLRGLMKQYENIFLLTYEIISLSVFCLCFRRLLSQKRLYVLESNQIDMIRQSRVKRMFWRLLGASVTHIVKEESMHEYIVSNFKNAKVRHIKRNYNQFGTEYVNPDAMAAVRNKFNIAEEGLVIFSPSQTSSDPKHVTELIEECNHREMQQRVTFVVKTNDEGDLRSYDNVRVIKEFLRDEEFYNLMELADIIWFPYRKSYELRSSTMLFDAIHFEKPVVAVDNTLFRNYLGKYQIGRLYRTGDEFCAAIESLAAAQAAEFDFQRMKSDFDDNVVIEDMYEKIQFDEER